MSYDRIILETDLRIDEGYRDRPYKDSRGIWTAGIGHNLEAHGIKPESLVIPISPGLIEKWFQEDLASAEAALDRNFKGWRDFPDNVQLAVMNLVFNMGWGDGSHGLSSFKNMLSAMLAGDWAAAADHLLHKSDGTLTAYAQEVGGRADRIADLISDAPTS